MGKIVDAINRAEWEYKKISPDDAFVGGSAWLTQTRVSDVQAAPSRVGLLKNKLLRGYRDKGIKTIMISGTDHNCGATFTAVSLATTLANDAGYKVLLVDANLQTPELHSIFHTEPNNGINELLSGDGIKRLNITKVGPGELFMVPCGAKHYRPNGHFDSPVFAAFMRQARRRFDFIILDAAPVTKYSEPHTICSKVDGVIIVVTYGKTRRQVAQRIKKELEDAGANLLGVVINKRRHYIPDWIYRRL